MTKGYKRVMVFDSPKDAETFFDIIDAWDNGGIENGAQYGTTESSFTMSSVEEVELPDRSITIGYEPDIGDQHGDTDWEAFAELVYATAQEMKSLRAVGGPGYECRVNPQLLHNFKKYFS